MSQLLEKLRRAAEVFADPKVEKEVSDDERGVKAKENVVQKVDSIFKKLNMAAGKLTLSERKFEEEKVADKNELFNEKAQLESEEPLEVPKGEKKRARLTVGVRPEGDREKRKKVPKGGGNQTTIWRRSSKYHATEEIDRVWEVDWATGHLRWGRSTQTRGGRSGWAR